MNRWWCTFAVVLSTAHGLAAEQPAPVTLPTGLVPANAKATPASVVCFLEGPAIDAAGNIFFSDIAGNRILKRSPAGQITVFRADSGRTNGNTFDTQGRL